MRVGMQRIKIPPVECASHQTPRPYTTLQPPHSASTTAERVSTYLHGKPWGEVESDEVPQAGKVGAGSRHQVYDGGDLLHQGQRVLLAHPQGALEPAGGHTGRHVAQLCERHS